MAEEESIELLFDLEEPAEQEKKAEIASEPLFAAMLRDVVAKLWEGDAVMADFVVYVAMPLSDVLGHEAAKGGEFAQRHLAEGKKRVGDYIKDQSMRAHLINGLFPVLHIARTLQAWGAPNFRAYDDVTRRVFIAGYVLHDFLKLPGVEQELQAAGFGHDKAVGVAQMPTLEAIFQKWCVTLGLDDFLKPIGDLVSVTQDLIYTACNTQVKWGTLRNLSLLKHLRLAPTQLALAEDLSHLSDLLAYVIKTPPEVINPGIRDDITTLSDGLAQLNYHHLADNRGVLTNFIHNATLHALAHDDYRVAILYAPSGVVYLEHKKLAPALPAIETVAEAAIEKIKTLVSQQLATTQNGIKRDGKGMKYAGYYWLFFELPQFIKIGAQATFKVVHEGKKPSSGKRFAKMQDGQWMPAHVNVDLPDDIRVDQLAEWCYLAESQVGERRPDFDTAKFLLGEMGLGALENDFNTVPRDNRAGGVGYHWYFAAGNYIKQNPHLEPAEVREKAEAWAKNLSQAVSVAAAEAKQAGRNDWDDLRDYIHRNLTLGGGLLKPDLRAALGTELSRYTSAKRKGHGVTKVCALCSSSYRVDKQREAAVLFAPQVYSNKRPLHGTDAIRDICAICSMEMMLRQILMNRSAASGGDFEGRRVRYLFFYPTYFFTPETLEIVRRMNTQIKRLSITELRSQLVGKDGHVDLSPKTLQRLQQFMFSGEPDPATDRYVRLHFPPNETVTFDFIGVPPPSRDPKDAEAWVHPALLSLLLPLCLDIKVVASESSIPPMLEAGEIDETMFLDAPHAAINYLTHSQSSGQTRLHINLILPTVRRLISAYFIHTDANATSGAGGFDYRWQDLPATARALAQSPLYAFHYLKKWQRKQKLDSLPAKKAAEYLQYVTYLGDDPMTHHARELTQLYRQFYRAKRWNSNSILQPVSKTARAILDADTKLFGAPEALIDATYGALHAFIDRAYREQLAFPPRGSTRDSQQTAMRAFATHFVNDIFYGVFRGDKSALRGKQLNLLRNACEVIYLAEAAKDKAERELAEIEESESQA